MKHLVFLVISFMFLTFGNAFAADGDQQPTVGGLDFTYSTPEVFFTEPEVLKLGVVWEILNCYAWHNNRAINECENLEFYVINPTAMGDIAYTAILESTGCLINDDACTTKVRLPLESLLSPVDYEKYKMGIVVMTDLQLHMAFGGEEDQFGRIVHRHLARAWYDIKLILNGTGYGTVSVISMERVTP